MSHNLETDMATTTASSTPTVPDPPGQVERLQTVVDQQRMPATACEVLGFAGDHHLPVRILSTGGLGVFSDAEYKRLGESPTFAERCLQLLRADLHIRLILWGPEQSVITPVVTQLVYRFGHSDDSCGRIDCRLIDTTTNREQVAPFIAVGNRGPGPTALLIEESERQCAEVSSRKALAQILSGSDDLFTKQVEYFDSIWDQLEVRRQVKVTPRPRPRPRAESLASSI